jgi:hypothetical protein
MKKFLPFHEVTPKVAVILLVWLGTAFVPTYAQPVLWTLDNVAFEDGSTATGSFEYDPSVGTFGTYSNITVTVTLPGGSTILYDATRPNANLNTQAAFVPEGGVNTGQRHLTLRFLTPLTAGGGTVPLILANTFLGTCFNGACTAFGSPAWFATMATPVTGEPLAAPAPTVTCRPATVMLDASGDASLDPNLVVLAASGAPPLNFSISPSTFDCGDVPSTMTTVTLTDGNGATASCTATVTVEDNTAPVAPAAPADLELDCAAAVPPPVDLTAQDNCDGAITVSPTVVKIFGSCVNDFTEIRTWTFTDVWRQHEQCQSDDHGE